jgi:hypothetical protein
VFECQKDACGEADLQPIKTNKNQYRFAGAAFVSKNIRNKALIVCAVAQRSNKFPRNEIFRVVREKGFHKMARVGWLWCKAVEIGLDLFAL